MAKKQSPPEIFDQKLADEIVGKRLLIGITHENHAGVLERRSQIFGLVLVAKRDRGICIRSDQDGKDVWFPPDTRGIRPTPPGEYRNHATGEVVHDPDYIVTWTLTAGPQK